MTPMEAFPPRPLPVSGPHGPWAPLLNELAATGIGLVHASLDAWRAHLPTGVELAALLGSDWDRYHSLTSLQLRERFVATRMLMKHVAAVALCVSPHELELGYGLNGRVYLRGHDQVDISLSHTGDMLFVGITSLGVIGVDVEPADRFLSGQDVEQLMCTPHERWRLATTATEDQNLLLLRLWTLKEAYSKALGQGLRFPFTEFGFDLTVAGSSSTAILERANGNPVGDHTWRFGNTLVLGKHLAAVAVQGTRQTKRPDTRVGTALNRQILAAIHGSLSRATV